MLSMKEADDQKMNAIKERWRQEFTQKSRGEKRKKDIKDAEDGQEKEKKKLKNGQRVEQLRTM